MSQKVKKKVEKNKNKMSKKLSRVLQTICGSCTDYSSQRRGSIYCVTKRTPDESSNYLLCEKMSDSVLSQSAASDNGMGTWEILKEREKKNCICKDC